MSFLTQHLQIKEQNELQKIRLSITNILQEDFQNFKFGDCQVEIERLVIKQPVHTVFTWLKNIKPDSIHFFRILNFLGDLLEEKSFQGPPIEISEDIAQVQQFYTDRLNMYVEQELMFLQNTKKKFTKIQEQDLFQSVQQTINLKVVPSLIDQLFNNLKGGLKGRTAAKSQNIKRFQ